MIDPLSIRKHIIDSSLCLPDGTDYILDEVVPYKHETFEFTCVPTGVKAIEGMKPGYRIIFRRISPINKAPWPWKSCDFTCLDNRHYVGIDTYQITLWLKRGVLKRVT